jgi:uncharacterized membrane protein
MQQSITSQELDSGHPRRTTRDPVSTRAIIAMDRAIYRFSRRWLPAFTGLSTAYAGAVVLAPLLAASEHGRSANAIYGFFGLFCHQNPDRSFHLFGEKFACCERCAAIYASIALFGWLFAFFRTRLRKPQPVALVALISPIVLDGLAVGSGLYGGTVAMRLITGTLFGFAMIWLLYPVFERGFTGIRERLENLFTRLVEQGRARPLSA